MDASPPALPLAGKTILVTGANGGIGKETTRGLARLGAHVVMGCRSVERGEAAREELAREVPADRLEVMRLDVSLAADARRFARDFRARHRRLDALVNNAGIHTARREVTEEGVERTFATNHLGPFVLTNELLPLLRASAPARVVTVASEAHRFGGMRWDDLQFAGRWSGVLAYCQSKLANVLFAFELARRLDGTGVTSNALHPGSVRSNWARGPESGLLRLAVGAATPFLVSVEKGAQNSIHVASAPDLASVTGRYFLRKRPRNPSRQARDPEAQRRLWEATERLLATLPP